LRNIHCIAYELYDIIKQKERNGKLVEKRGRKTKGLRCIHYGSRVIEVFCLGKASLSTMKATFFLKCSSVTPLLQRRKCMMKKVRLCAVLFLLLFVFARPKTAEAATAKQREQCKQEIMGMLYSADVTKHNILQYRMTVSEFEELYHEIQYGDGVEIMGAYFPSMQIDYTYTMLFGYVNTIWLSNVNEDAMTRYHQMVPVIDSIIAGLEEDMTDLDKLIYLHDELVEMVTYTGTTDAMYIASGAFVDKKAVCAGYAKALNVLLHRVGIDTTYVKGTSLNHGWSYVKLDGAWYHVDPTWDDTRTPVSGKVSRKNLLRNDAEFCKDHGEWVLRRIDESSVSTEYEDWFVHDIVGEMCFENGVWYYLDTSKKAVMAADAKGENIETLFDYSAMGMVSLVDALEEGLVLTINGREICQTVEAWQATAEADNSDEMKEDVSEDAVSLGESVFGIEMSELSNWRSGHYNEWTGTHATNPKRICLNAVVANTESQYKIKISNENYAFVVRELNANKKIMASVQLKNGDRYVPGEGTAYLAISLYNCAKANEYAVYYSEYEALFATDFEIGFFAVNQTESEEGPEYETEEVPKENDTTQEEESPKKESITGLRNAFSLDLCDFSNWRTGQYNEWTGTYATNPKRICLKEVVPNTESQYKIQITNENYAMIVRELNANKKISASVELRNGDVYVPGEGTAYFAISLYNCVKANEYAVYFSEYEALFTEGFEVGFFVESMEV